MNRIPTQQPPPRRPLTRRSFLHTASASAAALAGCASVGDRPPRKRPNILFAFADDQSWPHASAYGDKAVSTPAFDRMAREGVLFTHSFAACPSCTPSRSAVLSGRNIWQLEQAGVLYGAIPPKYPLFTHLLEDSGYRVGYTGKPWGPGQWDALGLSRHPNGQEYNARKLDPPPPAGIDERDYAANFEDFLADRPADAPFFFWFGATEPHRVYGQGLGLAAGKNLADADIPAFWPDAETVRSDILDYYVEIEHFDSQLARMIDTLERIGELDDTIIVVTSDNGMPFPRAKVNLYDWGLRMPLAIRWGAEVPGGRVIDDLVSHIDFAPTFLDAAGLEPPAAMAGQSLLPILVSAKQGVVDPERDAVYAALERHTWCRPGGATYPIRSIRTREWLYLRNFEPERWPTGGPTFISSNRTFHGDVDACPTRSFLLAEENRVRYAGEYELSFGKRPAEELYRVGDDPGQVNNLAGDPEYAEVKRGLAARLEARLIETADPRIEGRDPWQGYVYRQTIGFGATFNRSLSEEERREARERAAHKPE